MVFLPRVFTDTHDGVASQTHYQTLGQCKINIPFTSREKYPSLLTRLTARTTFWHLRPISLPGTRLFFKKGIMTGVYERWCSSTLHIRWGLCDRLGLVLVCRGRYGLGGVVLLFILDANLGGVGPLRGLGGGGRAYFFIS